MLDRLTLLSAIGFLAACGGAEPPALAVATEDLWSPAGPRSGEPFLTVDGDDVLLSWLEASPHGGHDLRFARWDGREWGESRLIANSERFFVNWADFPSINAIDGVLWAHWLERGPAGGYDYGVRVVRSADAGESWSEPWTPHDDRSPTEHGFVSTFPVGGGAGFVWLDGRKHAEGADGTPPTNEMTLRFRAVGAEGAPGPEGLVDGRVCDCCQTDAAVASSGPVIVYRDRSDAEIRDIYVSRLVDGAWSEGRPVHEDGWYIEGCPVNGPAVAASGDRVAVAWFTAANDVPVVNVALSDDAGVTFGAPTRVDAGNPAGRVDLLMTGDGSVLVTWIERTGGESADVMMRRVSDDGLASEPVTLAGSSSARASGFPRMVEAPDGSIVLAWTDVGGEEAQVRVQRLYAEAG